MNDLFGAYQLFLDEEIVQNTLLIRDVSANIQDKIEVVSWLARKALFYEITPITQIQIRCRSIFNWKNVEYIKSNMKNIIAMNLTNSLNLMLSGAND